MNHEVCSYHLTREGKCSCNAKSVDRVSNPVKIQAQIHVTAPSLFTVFTMTEDTEIFANKIQVRAQMLKPSASTIKGRFNSQKFTIATTTRVSLPTHSQAKEKCSREQRKSSIFLPTQKCRISLQRFRHTNHLSLKEDLHKAGTIEI